MNRTKSYQTLALLFFLLILQIPASAAGPGSSQKPTPAEKLVNDFLGKWVGVVIFRQPVRGGDPPSSPKDRKIFSRATWVTIVKDKKPGSMRLISIYDDVNKIDTSTLILTFDLERNSLKYRYDNDSEGELFEVVSGLPEFLDKGEGQLVLTRHDDVDGHRVDTRLTLTLLRNLFIREREQKAPGEDFISIQRLVLTREQAPSKPAEGVTP